MDLDDLDEAGRTPSLVGEVNAHLPPHIRVFSFLKVSKKFRARDACTRRFYEYVLPASVFLWQPQPHETQSGLAAFQMNEAEFTDAERSLVEERVEVFNSVLQGKRRCIRANSSFKLSYSNRVRGGSFFPQFLRWGEKQDAKHERGS